MAVRSNWLAGPVAVAGPTSDFVYTVPAGRTFRGIVCIVNTASTKAADATLIRNGVVFYRRLVEVPDPGSAVLDYVVLDPGDELRANTAASDQLVSVSVWGSLLMGEPA